MSCFRKASIWSHLKSVSLMVMWLMKLICLDDSCSAQIWSFFAWTAFSKAFEQSRNSLHGNLASPVAEHHRLFERLTDQNEMQLWHHISIYRKMSSRKILAKISACKRVLGDKIGNNIISAIWWQNSRIMFSSPFTDIFVTMHFHTYLHIYNTYQPYLL